MTEYVKEILLGQLEAGLSMMRRCVVACPERCWDERVGKATFRKIVYHTLYYVDLYLSRGPEQLEEREWHKVGGAQRGPMRCVGLSKAESLLYIRECRRKAKRMMREETEESLRGGCGFAWRTISRGEMWIYNTRHVQHHAGQLSAFLRKVEGVEVKQLGWV